MQYGRVKDCSRVLHILVNSRRGLETEKKEKTMREVVNFFKQLKRDENGASLIEYTVLLAILLVAVIAVITGVGDGFLTSGVTSTRRFRNCAPAAVAGDVSLSNALERRGAGRGGRYAALVAFARSAGRGAYELNRWPRHFASYPYIPPALHVPRDAPHMQAR